jgi:hypothetical protein
VVTSPPGSLTSQFDVSVVEERPNRVPGGRR